MSKSSLINFLECNLSVFGNLRSMVLNDYIIRLRIQLFLQCFFRRNGQFVSSFSSSCLNYPSAVSCRHSIFETMLVSSFPAGRLECSFHFFIYLKLDRFCSVSKRSAKIDRFFLFTNLWITFVHQTQPLRR